MESCSIPDMREEIYFQVNHMREKDKDVGRSVLQSCQTSKGELSLSKVGRELLKGKKRSPSRAQLRLAPRNPDVV